MPAVLLTLFLASCVAFVVARFSFRFNLILLGLFTAANLLPQQALLIPLYRAYREVPLPLWMSDSGQLLDSYWGLILVNVAFQTGFCTFVLSNYMKALPHEMFEAARVDGAGVPTQFFRITLPLCRPALAALATLQVTWIYNEFFWATVLMQSGDKFPITSSLNNLRGQFFTDYNLLSAGSILIAIPVLVGIFAIPEIIDLAVRGTAIAGEGTPKNLRAGVMEGVRDTVRQPFCDYLLSSLDLMKNLARSLGQDIASETFIAHDMEALLSHAFERYFNTSGLFGTPETCLHMVDRLKEIGVDEIGCLIDFGVDTDAVLASLHGLKQVMEWSNQYTKSTDDETIPAQIARSHVTHLQCTPSMARMLLLDPQARASLGALRTMMIGGEAFAAALATELRQATSATLMNMYGPTETTIWSATYTVYHIENRLPIGQPIANTTLYILDRSLQPVPVGTAGELYIGGEGVVRGYLNRPELAAERCIPDPFSSTAGRRLYRTGDLARYLPDSSIEFLGRVDHQVKIRGHRIELGEIETVLEQHPGIREAVVTAREDTPGDLRLIAYLVPSDETLALSGARDDRGHAPIAYLQNELRSLLTAQLPEYMVPSVVVVLESLPLTPNGKIDRRALPAPEGKRPDLVVEYVAPQTDLEQLIASIWQEVLQLGAVGIHDNFFEVGGTSLLLVQVHSKLREQLNQEVPVVELFRSPTIHALAQSLGRGPSAQPSMHHVEDRAKRRTESGSADAVNRQRQFMQARRRRRAGSPMQLAEDSQGGIA